MYKDVKTLGGGRMLFNIEELFSVPSRATLAQVKVPRNPTKVYIYIYMNGTEQTRHVYIVCSAHYRLYTSHSNLTCLRCVHQAS